MDSFLCECWKCSIYFDSFGVEHVPKEIKKFIRNKNIITNIYRIQAHNAIICGYICIGFIDFILKGKILPKIYLVEKSLVLSIICSKWKNEDEKLFKEEESIEIRFSATNSYVVAL